MAPPHRHEGIAPFLLHPPANICIMSELCREGARDRQAGRAKGLVMTGTPWTNTWVVDNFLTVARKLVAFPLENPFSDLDQYLANANISPFH